MIKFDKKKMDDQLKNILELIKSTDSESQRTENVTFQKTNKNS